MRLLPAPAGTGIVFRRVDLDGFLVEAISRNVARVSYATSLMKKGVLISTTEHLLSAFIGLGVDNAIVELDNLELPILDGSARPFMDMVLNVGLKKQRRQRVYMRIRREVELREGDKFIAIYPAPGYSVAYTINFPHPLIGRESFEVELSDGQYRREIAPARTFGFVEQEKAMRNQGLIRGASEQNVIVLTRDSVVNGPLRYPDEFCPPQGAGPDRRPGAGGAAHCRTRGGRPCRTRHAYRAGFAAAARSHVVGRDYGRDCEQARVRSGGGTENLKESGQWPVISPTLAFEGERAPTA